MQLWKQLVIWSNQPYLCKKIDTMCNSPLLSWFSLCLISVVLLKSAKVLGRTGKKKETGIQGLYTKSPWLHFHTDSTKEPITEGEKTDLRAIWEGMVRHGGAPDMSGILFETMVLQGKGASLHLKIVSLHIVPSNLSLTLFFTLWNSAFYLSPPQSSSSQSYNNKTTSQGQRCACSGLDVLI